MKNALFVSGISVPSVPYLVQSSGNPCRRPSSTGTSLRSLPPGLRTARFDREGAEPLRWLGLFAQAFRAGQGTQQVLQHTRIRGPFSYPHGEPS